MILTASYVTGAPSYLQSCHEMNRSKLTGRMLVFASSTRRTSRMWFPLVCCTTGGTKKGCVDDIQHIREKASTNPVDVQKKNWFQTPFKYSFYCKQHTHISSVKSELVLIATQANQSSCCTVFAPSLEQKQKRWEFGTAYSAIWTFVHALSLVCFHFAVIQQ